MVALTKVAIASMGFDRQNAQTAVHVGGSGHAGEERFWPTAFLQLGSYDNAESRRIKKVKSVVAFYFV